MFLCKLRQLSPDVGPMHARPIQTATVPALHEPVVLLGYERGHFGDSLFARDHHQLVIAVRAAISPIQA